MVSFQIINAEGGVNVFPVLGTLPTNAEAVWNHQDVVRSKIPVWRGIGRLGRLLR